MRSRWVYWALEALSAAAGIAFFPIIALMLFTDVPGVLWFLIGWVAVEVVIILIRPAVLRRTDEYRGPQGPVP